MSGMSESLNWDELLKKIDSDDQEVRHVAIEQLVEYPSLQCVPVLLRLLGDSSWRLRKRAVDLLVSLSDQSGVVTLLVGALSDEENPGRRNAAVEALVQCGQLAVMDLLATTYSEDRDIRKFAIDILARIADGRSTTRLIELLDDPDPNVQGSAADALGMMGDQSAARTILRIAADSESNHLVRFSSLRALARLEVDASPADIGDVFGDPLLRPAGFAVLAHGNSKESIELLLEGLSAHERSSREAAMDALLKVMGRQEADTAEFLTVRISEVSNGCAEIVTDAIERLNNTDITTQLTLIPFLGVLGSPEGVLPVLRVARDEALTDVALGTLSAMGDVAESVIVSEWSGLDSELRLLACEYFGRRSGELSSGRLLEAMDDQDVDIRVSAARALGNRRETDAIKVLIRRLELASQEEELEQELELEALGDAMAALLEEKSNDELYRTEAIELLSEKFRGAPEAVRLVIAQVFRGAVTSKDETLIAALFKDPCAGVRREAVKAFGQLEDEESAESLRLALTDESPKVRVAAAETLGSMQHACSMEDLRHLASDEDAQVRAAAMRAAGRAVSGANVSPENLDAAMSQMEGGLQDEGLVVMAVLEALQTVGGARSVAMALRLLDSTDSQLVQAVLACVGEHGTDDQVRGIIPFIAHEDWSVRVEVIRIIEARKATDAIEPLKALVETEEDAYVADAASRALTTLEE